jgi:hypothetical protein
MCSAMSQSVELSPEDGNVMTHSVYWYLRMVMLSLPKEGLQFVMIQSVLLLAENELRHDTVHFIDI